MFLAIVPAYNEAETIGSVVRSLFNHVDQVVVVDDGSDDTTSHEAKNAGAVVLCHAVNRGQGAALETGHEYARRLDADVVLHFDADGQFDALDIPVALQRFKESNADVLFGSRFLDGRSAIPWLKRHVVLPVARHINRLLTGLALTDAHNGFRILNQRALDSIVLTHDAMAHATEILLLVRRHRLRYIECPVKVVYREYGQGIDGGLQILKDFILGKFI